MIKKIAIFVCILFLASLASASFNFTKLDIKTNYGPNELLGGRFSLFFTNESNSNFTSTFGNSVSLIGLLNASNYKKGMDFYCSPRDCLPDYSTSSGSSNRTILLNNQKLLGFLIPSGNSTTIRNFTFRVSSSVNASCLNQLSGDLFNKGFDDFYNSKYIVEDCGNRDYGCFDGGLVNGEGDISNTPYCEKITLPEAPAYRLGADVKNSTTKSAKLTMQIFDLDNTGGLLGRCTLPIPSQPSPTIQSVDCIVNYSSRKQFDALVCISADNSGSNYKIAIAGGTNKCGSLGYDNPQFNSNYAIYANSLKYDKVDGVFDYSAYRKLNPTSDLDLISLLQKYIDERYGGNCDGGCVIPFALSGATQNVTINNIELKYNTDSVIGTTTSSLYDLTSEDAVISLFGNREFKFENLGIMTPSASGAKKLDMYFDGSRILSENISVISGFAFDVSPRYVFLGQQTQFNAILAENNSYGIKSSVWDFGDSTKLNSKTSSAVHGYSSAADYVLTVTVTRSDGINSTKSFKIFAGNVAESVRQLIAIDEQRIANVSSQVNALPSWLTDDITKRANLTQMGLKLADIKKVYESANKSDSVKMGSIIDQLIKLDVPYFIGINKKGKDIPLEVGFSGINVNYIKQLSGTSSLSDVQIKEAIQKWNDANYDSKIDFYVISKIGDLGEKPLLSDFVIKLVPKGESGAYLIMDYPFDSIRFKERGNEKSVLGGTYLGVSGVQTIEFAVPDWVKATELGAYVSPELSKLGRTGYEHVSAPGFNWSLFLVGLILILILGGVVWYYGRKWYVNNYESHLFNNPRDLGNLMGFIINARNNKVADKEIRRKLGVAGWSSEQIDYALNKIKKMVSERRDKKS